MVDAEVTTTNLFKKELAPHAVAEKAQLQFTRLLTSCGPADLLWEVTRG